MIEVEKLEDGGGDVAETVFRAEVGRGDAPQSAAPQARPAIHERACAAINQATRALADISLSEPNSTLIQRMVDEFSSPT